MAESRKQTVYVISMLPFKQETFKTLITGNTVFTKMYRKTEGFAPSEFLGVFNHNNGQDGEAYRLKADLKLYVVLTELEQEFVKESDMPGAEIFRVIIPSTFADYVVEEFESSDLPEKIEILYADLPVIVKYRHRFKSLKWAHTTWNGIDVLFKNLDPAEPYPSFTLTKTSGSVNAPLIAEYVLGYILLKERSFIQIREAQKIKEWNQLKYSHTRTLSTVSIGILGVGSIGKVVAKLCKDAGMSVWGLTRRSVTPETRCPYVDEYRTIEDLADVLQNCDYICNILPSTPYTRSMLSGDVLSHCQQKKGVFINVGRGDVVDNDSIVRAIKNGWIGGAILDVFGVEPLPDSSPLWDLPEVKVTPHISGWSTEPQYMQSLNQCFIDNYHRYIEGKPLQDVLDWAQGY